MAKQKTIFKNEVELVNEIVKQLQDNYLEVYPRVSIASRKYYGHWEKWHKPLFVPPAQPDIDILVLDKNHKLHAIEVKYFRKEKGSTLYPFYYGISEALALLRFGVETVSLWNFFDPSFPKKYFGGYIMDSRFLIQELNLNINASWLAINQNSDDKIKFIFIGSPIRADEQGLYPVEKNVKPMYRNQYVSWLPDPTIGILNPLKEKIESKKTLEFLYLTLKIPRT